MQLATRTNRLSQYDPKFMFNRGIIAQTGLIPEGARFLKDTWPLQVKDTKQIISEAVKGGVPAMRVTGVYQMADQRNANGRVYPKSILEEAIDALQEDLNNRSVWGELDHSDTARIHLDRVAMLHTKLWMEGKTVFGESEIIEDLPLGKQLATLLRHGRIGISSRGVGDVTTRESGGIEETIVCEGFRIITLDAVAEPSVSQAVLNICEGKLRPVTRITKPALSTKKTFFQASTYDGMLVEEVNKFLKG